MSRPALYQVRVIGLLLGVFAAAWLLAETSAGFLDMYRVIAGR